jgi:dimethylamine monooxygenase subunit A
MAMDLVTVPESAWFELDQLYSAEMAERRQLLDEKHEQVFAAWPASAPARTEALEVISTALIEHHPDWFTRASGILSNRVTGEAWDQAASALDPLEIAARLVQEDLCLIQNSPDGPIFTAGVVCFPSRWRLLEKIGKPLAAVHGPVPHYADRLASPVDRFMRHLKVGRIASRLNWSVLNDPALFQPTGKWRVDGSSDVTCANAGERLFLRVERQTLRRLPQTDAVLFGIRVHVYPLQAVIDRPDRAVALASAVRALPTDIVHYKSVMPFRDALLDWLDGRGRSDR